MGLLKKIIEQLKSLKEPPKKHDNIKKEINVNLKVNLKYNVIFKIDFLNINFDEKLKNSEIMFPENSNQIIINGKSMYFNSYNIKEAGMSADNLYRKIYTGDFTFWVNPSVYDDILNIMKDRELKYRAGKRDDKARIRTIYSEKFEYDKIDEDIYKCCIVDKSESDLGNINCGGSRSDFKKIETIISDICKEHGGRYYKTQSQNTKFVIIFGCSSRTASKVKYYRDKGYKVTSFESVIEKLCISNLWDIHKMKNEVERIKETISML